MIDNIPLEKSLDNLPKEPGVYFMYNQEHQVIYVGKAKILYNRVRQYFHKNKPTSHYASYLMKGKIYAIDWIVTDTEQEALILEANLVKQHQPRYNVMLKDDKHYPYLRVSLSEVYPRIYITRKIDPKTKDLFFGPYTYSTSLKRILDTIYKLFKIRDCEFKLPSKTNIQPCLSYHIKRCDAPCNNSITSKEYSTLVDHAILFLKGKKEELITKLTAVMKDQSINKQYEQAAQTRDQISHLQYLKQKQKMDIRKNNTSQDFVAISRKNKLALAIILQLRNGVITSKQTFELYCPLEEPEEIITSFFLMQYYQQKESIPSTIFVNCNIANKRKIEDCLSQIKTNKVTLLYPQKGEKKQQIDLALKNANLLLNEKLIKEQSQHLRIKSLVNLQKILNLPHPPYHIEAFDISHLSGTNTVASMVCFKNGQPKKSAYRKYKIKTVHQIDDFASIYEVIYRRFSKLKKEKKKYPNLIVIDGGKGQLSSAYRALTKLNCAHLPMISLAKKLEEIFFPKQSKPLLMSHCSTELQILQHIRDESHRFAITFQKLQRKRDLTKTSLHHISGLGEKSISKLLQIYNTPNNVWDHSWVEWKEKLGLRLANILQQNKNVYSKNKSS